MIRGITLVILACLIWGLIYVVPQFMTAFNPMEVAIGRYTCYGVISLLFMTCFRWKALIAVPRELWVKALWLGFLTNIGFYPTTVLSMRYANSAIAALILGLSPIAIAFYANWREKECSFKSLIIPTIAISIGLLLVNIEPLMEKSIDGSIFLYCLGLFSGFLSLALWCAYVVSNGRFLKNNPSIIASDWCSIIGIATLAWIVVIGGILACFTPHTHLQKFYLFTPELQSFILGSLVLGFICSWLGFFLWNKGSSLLPVSLAGQLTIFETIFGLVYIYALELRWPTSLEWIGVVSMLGGIYLSIRVYKEVPAPEVATI